MTAAKLIHANRVLFIRFVKKSVAALHKLWFIKFIVSWQAHRDKVVVTDHGFVAAVNDRFYGKFGRFDNLTELLVAEFEGTGCHGETIFFQKFRCLTVEKIEGIICLNGEVEQTLGEVERAEV